MLHRLIINLACSTLALVFLTYPAVSQAVPASDSNEQINDNSKSEISQEDLLNAAIYNNRGGISSISYRAN